MEAVESSTVAAKRVSVRGTHTRTLGYTHTQVITLTPVVSEYSTNAVTYKGLILTLGYNDAAES